MIQSLAILLLLQLCGEALARWLKLPLPGSLVGMMLLLLVLLLRKKVGQDLQQTSQAMLQNLMLLFIPLIAGIVAYTDYIRSQWWPFIVACIAGTIIAQLVTAWTLRWMLQRGQVSRQGLGNSGPQAPHPQGEGHERQ